MAIPVVFFGNIFTSMAAGVTFNLELYALTFFWGLSGEMSLLLVGLAFYPTRHALWSTETSLYFPMKLRVTCLDRINDI